MRKPDVSYEVHGTLAISLHPRADPPDAPLARADPPDAPLARPVAPVVPIDLRARREVEGWAARFAQAAAEIVGGDRPAAQLVRWTSRTVFEDLQYRAAVVARAGHHQPGVSGVQPVRPRVSSVHTYFVTAEIAETSIHLRYGPRSRALAARFEHRPDRTGQPRWLCTALEWA